MRLYQGFIKPNGRICVRIWNQLSLVNREVILNKIASIAFRYRNSSFFPDIEPMVQKLLEIHKFIRKRLMESLFKTQSPMQRWQRVMFIGLSFNKKIALNATIGRLRCIDDCILYNEPIKLFGINLQIFTISLSYV